MQGTGPAAGMGQDPIQAGRGPELRDLFGPQSQHYKA